jgi:hypothetical protein
MLRLSAADVAADVEATVAVAYVEADVASRSNRRRRCGGHLVEEVVVCEHAPVHEHVVTHNVWLDAIRLLEVDEGSTSGWEEKRQKAGCGGWGQREHVRVGSEEVEGGVRAVHAEEHQESVVVVLLSLLVGG